MGHREVVTSEFVDKWEVRLNEYAAGIRENRDRSMLMQTYTGVLGSSSSRVLDPLQITAYRVIVDAIVDALIHLHPAGTPITAVIDEITEAHFGVIEQVFGKDPENVDDESEDL